MPFVIQVKYFLKYPCSMMSLKVIRLFHYCCMKHCAILTAPRDCDVRISLVKQEKSNSSEKDSIDEPG